MSDIKINLEHLAELARLNFSEQEQQAIAPQLGAILEYVGKLSAVDTTGVSPSTFMTEAENVWREDIVRECEPQTVERSLAAFPKCLGTALSVPGVFEERTE